MWSNNMAAWWYGQGKIYFQLSSLHTESDGKERRVLKIAKENKSKDGWNLARYRQHDSERNFTLTKPPLSPTVSTFFSQPPFPFSLHPFIALPTPQLQSHSSWAGRGSRGSPSHGLTFLSTLLDFVIPPPPLRTFLDSLFAGFWIACHQSWARVFKRLLFDTSKV